MEYLVLEFIFFKLWLIIVLWRCILVLLWHIFVRVLSKHFLAYFSILLFICLNLIFKFFEALKNLGIFTTHIITPSRRWFRRGETTTQNGIPKSATRWSDSNNPMVRGTKSKKSHTRTKRQWQSLPLAPPTDTFRSTNDKFQAVTELIERDPKRN